MQLNTTNPLTTEFDFDESSMRNCCAAVELFNDILTESTSMAPTKNNCRNLSDYDNLTQAEYLRLTAWDSEFKIFAETKYAYIVPPLLAVLLVATLMNLIILISSCYLVKKPSVNLRICISLAASDCAASGTCLLDLFLASYLSYAIGKWWKDNLPTCLLLVVRLCRISGMFTSCAHLCLLSFNHFIGTKYPLKYKSCMTTQLCSYLLVIIWISPPLYFFSSFLLEQMSRLGTDLACEYELSAMKKLTYGGAVWLFFLLTTSAHGYILIRYYRAQGESDIRIHHRERKKIANEHKVVKVSLAITLTFALGWLPYSTFDALICAKRRRCQPIYADLETYITCLYPQFECDSACIWQSSDFSVDSFMAMSMVRYALVLCKLASNALIYTFRVPQIQAALIKMIGMKPNYSFVTGSPMSRFSRFSSKFRFSQKSPTHV